MEGQGEDTATVVQPVVHIAGKKNHHEVGATVVHPMVFIVYHSAVFGNPHHFCVHMSFKGRTVLFDCGIHPAYSGMAALPYFDEIDPSAIDVLLVTHFHLDHAASLPYFLEKTTFKGRVFMTHATKAIYRLLLSDYAKVSKVSVEDMLFDEQDINSTLANILHHLEFVRASNLH
ncbi:cleavage and polyadenylation specificity factor subunit 3-I-like, partial [Triticum urartu]